MSPSFALRAPLAHPAWQVLLLAGLLALSGCGGHTSTPPAGDAGPDVDGSSPITRCGGGDDPDSDFISSVDEGTGDADGDGIPNAMDTDSDGDGIDDSVEAGDANCLTPPIDTDMDGTPDFLDTDTNGDGTLDSAQATTDMDSDGIIDALDPDVDGDAIPNSEEVGDPAAPVDSDHDGTPDVFDDDSDGDSIRDVDEGRRDPDGDGIPNFRDPDSDGDGIDDAIEAGDANLATPPRSCPNEVDPATGMVAADGSPDFADSDSDNDGLGDREEQALGSDLCNIDSDGDSYGDLVEGAFEKINCPPAGGAPECSCATRADCTIPREDFFVVLPYLGDAVERDLDFATDIRVADVFFLTDTTGSMGGTLTNVKSTVATPGTGLIDRIRETIPDAYFGGGQHDDFPFGSYGGGPDQPFILAIGMTPPDRASAVQTAFSGMSLHGGADGPESSSEALYQILTGEGGSWMGSGSSTYMLRRYVGDCLDTGYGAPCFRDGALPIIVHFTDFCSHNGPPGESSSCSDYTGFTPAAHTWAQAMSEMTRRGAKYVGVNASSTSCTTVVGPDGRTPCYFMTRTAEESGSVDLDGTALVYDLPSGGGTGTIFADTVVNAIETIATRVPLDVDTALRDDPTDAVDATAFIRRRQPACRAAPPTDPCWTEPAGVSHADAVAAVDESTFFGAIPGTAVKFRISFQNTDVPGEASAQVYIAFIDVRGGGAAVLDTRQVFIVVPASTGGPVI